MKKIPFFLSRANAHLRGNLANFDHLLLVWSNRTNSDLHPFLENEIFRSNSEAADFLHCSRRTVQRYIKKGIISSYPVGPNQSIFMRQEVMEAVKQNPRLAALKKRTHAAPKVCFSTFLYPGLMFIEIRYLGWKGTVYCSCKYWRNDLKIKKLVKQVLVHQHTRKPFKIAPNELNF